MPILWVFYWWTHDWEDVIWYVDAKDFSLYMNKTNIKVHRMRLCLVKDDCYEILKESDIEIQANTFRHHLEKDDVLFMN